MHLAMVVEHTFDEHVAGYIELPTFLDHMGREPILHLSGDYYPDLVKEFYANMKHKTNRTFPTVIPSIKGVRIVLDREHLSHILGIWDEEEPVTIHINSIVIEEDPDWSYEATSSWLQILPHHPSWG